MRYLEGPLQPKPFCDSMILHFQSNEIKPRIFNSLNPEYTCQCSPQYSSQHCSWCYEKYRVALQTKVSSSPSPVWH